MNPKKLILNCPLCPGDILTLTVALESLHATYPDQYLTDMRTSCPAIWENNPHVTRIDDQDPEATQVAMEYPSVNHSNQRPVTFIEGYTEFLGQFLNRPLRAIVNRPQLYLSDEERLWMNQVCEHFTGGRDIPYWVVNAGVKGDYTAKQWPVESFQEVIDATRGRVQWVQMGEANHDHPQLTGVIDLRGKTDLRQLIRLVYHARGGLGPVTLLQHLCAAWKKPYICLLGGRESVPWVQYPHQHTLHTLGMLPCCSNGACWKSRVVKLNDNSPNDESLCDLPVLGLSRPVAKCMAMIPPSEVVAIIERVCSA